MITSGRVLKNTLFLFTSNAVVHALGFLVSIYVARKAGVEVFGQFSFAAAFAAYFLIISDPGISILAQRELARNGSMTQEYTGLIFLVRNILSVLALMVLIILAVTRFEDVKLWLTILFGIATLLPSLSLSWVFVAQEKMEYSALLSILTAVVYVALIIIFLQFTSSIFLFPIATLGSTLVGAIYSIYLFWKKNGRLKLMRTDFVYWKGFISAVWPFALSGFFVTNFFKLGIIILGYIGRDTEVGLYNAAYKLTYTLQLLSGMYFTALYPTLARLYSTSKADLEQIVKSSLELCGMLAMPLLFGGVLLARPIIEALYQGSYFQSVVILQILLVSVVSTLMAGTLAYLLMACDRQKEYLRAIIIPLIICTILYIVLIPRFSAIGVAIGYSVAEFLSLLLVYKSAKQVVKVGLFQYLGKPLLASLPMALGIILFQSLGLLWWIILPLAVCIYYLILWLIGGVSKDWIVILNTVIRKVSGKSKSSSTEPGNIQ